MVNKIEAILLKHFYGSSDAFLVSTLEAYTDDCTYIIECDTELLRDEFYTPETLEHIREENGWQLDQQWIKNYFLDHITDIEIIEK